MKGENVSGVSHTATRVNVFRGALRAQAAMCADISVPIAVPFKLKNLLA